MKPKPNVFYFIPQTGSITYGRMWSNYYQYALPASKLAKVKPRARPGCFNLFRFYLFAGFLGKPTLGGIDR